MAELVVDPVTRINGTATLRIVSEEAAPPEARFSAFGYRGFERIVSGAHLENLLPLVSRICGCDSVFHQVGAAMAVEKALGVETPPRLRALRELAMHGQLFERHAVSLSVHGLPDLLFPSSDPSLRNIVSIYRVDEEVVRRLLGIKSLGTTVLREVGGSAVHPVNFRPGGAARDITEEGRERLRSQLEEARPLLVETARLIKLLLRRSEELASRMGNVPVPSLALRGAGGMTLLGGNAVIASPEGAESTVLSHGELANKLLEENSPHSHVRPASLEGHGELRVGPLARINVNGSYGTPLADEELAEVRAQWGFPVHACLVGHALRVLEMIHAWERMRELLEEPPQGEISVAVSPAPGRGAAVLEAPEGMMVYEVEVTGEGLVKDVRLITPLQFNLRVLESSLAKVAGEMGLEGEPRTTDVLQMVVRAYAPCVPCGLH
ncbi:MAG: nickel-dependent hydrogenase large subunit [Actinobacteria bacterium]|nr:nickel-dependent hydrogenase large subunit [Actinomycetota bacterium]